MTSAIGMGILAAGHRHGWAVAEGGSQSITDATNGTDTPCFRFAQGWNDKHFGTYVLMSQLTGEAQFMTDAQRWLDFHSVGAGPKTTGGLMFVDGFGAIRYATNTAFISFVYADFLGRQNALFSRYFDFAKRQMDYALGRNPLNRSFVVGFGNNPPINPHHRTGHLGERAGQLRQHLLQHGHRGRRARRRPRPAAWFRPADLGRADQQAGLRSDEQELHLPALPARHHALRQDLRLHPGLVAGRLPEGPGHWRQPPG